MPKTAILQCCGTDSKPGVYTAEASHFGVTLGCGRAFWFASLAYFHIRSSALGGAHHLALSPTRPAASINTSAIINHQLPQQPRRTPCSSPPHITATAGLISPLSGHHGQPSSGPDLPGHSEQVSSRRRSCATANSGGAQADARFYRHEDVRHKATIELKNHLEVSSRGNSNVCCFRRPELTSYSQSCPPSALDTSSRTLIDAYQNIFTAMTAMTRWAASWRWASSSISTMTIARRRPHDTPTTYAQ